MGEHVDAVIDQELCVVVVVDVGEDLEVALVGFVDHGEGDFAGKFFGRAAAIVDDDLDGVNALRGESADHGAGCDGILIEFEAALDRVDASAVDPARTLSGSDLENFFAIAAESGGRGDAVERVGADAAGGVFTDVGVEIDDAGDDGVGRKVDYAGVFGRFDFRGAADVGDAARVDYERGVAQGRVSGAIDQGGVREDGDLRGCS